MTEYETSEILHNQMAHMWQAGQMYFTLVSAFLVVAYLVGNKLTRTQAAVITSLYLVWIASIVAGTIQSDKTYTKMSTALYEMGSLASEVTETETIISLSSFAFVQLAGVIASLWFMWSVRHPRTD
jgi:hypothetical protein